MVITFYYVAGRNWVTKDYHRCKECDSILEGSIERPATKAEYYGIIKPALEKNKNLKKVEIEYDEEG